MRIKHKLIYIPLLIASLCSCDLKTGTGTSSSNSIGKVTTSTNPSSSSIPSSDHHSSNTPSSTQPSSPSRPTSPSSPSSSPSSPSKPTTSSTSGDYVSIPSSGGKLKVRKTASSYYSSINFSSGKAQLKTDLHLLIDNHKVIDYDGLYDAFKDTDYVNGKLVDMYSDITSNKTCGNYKNEGDCYNREHSVPKSWFKEQKPAYSDLFHLYPTDGKVNGMRSNYPFGEVATPKNTSHNGSKLGNGVDTFGYEDIVFEPIDEYKGDFARTYFYFVTRYEGLGMTSGNGWVHFTTAGKYPGLTDYSLKLFAKWAKNDPVSQKEIDRNEIIYSKHQHNRNPFIDIPDLPFYLWEGLM